MISPFPCGLTPKVLHNFNDRRDAVSSAVSAVIIVNK